MVAQVTIIGSTGAGKAHNRRSHTKWLNIQFQRSFPPI
jgi:hypothetical protein